MASAGFASALVLTGALILAAPSAAAPRAGVEPSAAPESQTGFSPRLTTPRIAPLDKAQASPAQAAILAMAPDANIFKTLARHPALVQRWSPFGQYVLSGSTIQPRHREMAMLRMGWLCQAPYEWAAHARIAQARAGMTAEEVRAVAADPGGPGWSEADRAVLRMTDELRYDGAVSAATLGVLRKTYSEDQVAELAITAAQYQIVSMFLNALGVPFDLDNAERPPADLPPPAAASRARRTASAPLAVPPRLAALRDGFGAYIENEGRLSPRLRELLILREAWNQRADALWTRHAQRAKASGLTVAEIARIARGPAAPGWSAADRAALQAADDLRREAFISEPAWRELAKTLDEAALMEVIFTVGWADMLALGRPSP